MPGTVTAEQGRKRQNDSKQSFHVCPHNGKLLVICSNESNSCNTTNKHNTKYSNHINIGARKSNNNNGDDHNGGEKTIIMATLIARMLIIAMIRVITAS